MRSSVLMVMVCAGLAAQLLGCTPPEPGCNTDADCDKARGRYCDEAAGICRTAGANGEGSEGKACLPDGRCDTGLTCANELCVRPAPGSSSSSSGAASATSMPVMSSSTAGSSADMASSLRPSSSLGGSSSTGSSVMGQSSSQVASSGAASSSSRGASSASMGRSSSAVTDASSSVATSSSVMTASSSVMTASSSAAGASSMMMPSLTISFQLGSQTVMESAGTVMVEVRSSALAVANVAVAYTVSGTAQRPQDHGLMAGSVTITPGNQSAFIPVSISDDALLETNETVIITLSAPAGHMLGTPSQHTLTIDDNELDTQVVPAVSVVSPAAGSVVGVPQQTYSGWCEFGATLAITYVDRATEFAATAGSVNPASVPCAACTTAEHVDCGTAPNQRGKFTLTVGYAGTSGTRELQFTQTDTSGNMAAPVSHTVTYDKLPAQLAYLKASNTDPNDTFGSAVASDGDFVVVGGPFEASSGAGMPGNNSTMQAGAAYVYERVGGTLVFRQYLKASNAGAGDAFGYSVAIHGNTIVVGAPFEASGNGMPTDDSKPSAGAAYVFTLSGSTWTQTAYLKAQVMDAVDLFGNSVAVFNDRIVVGAPGESSAAFTVNGDQNNNAADGAGAAYVFLRSGTTWSQIAYLKANNANMGDGFGQSVSITGARVAVGAPFESSSSTGINGSGANNNALGSGAAYTYVISGSTYAGEAYVKASNTGAGDGFGYSVSLGMDRLAVGAPYEQSNAVGINGDPWDNSASSSGAAYLFQFMNSAWSQHSYVKASNSQAQDQFGYSVAVAGNLLAVGAPLEDSSATGVDGDGANNGAVDSGAAYLFVLPPSGMLTQKAYLKASNTGTGDNFGYSVDVSAFISVGAPYERSAAVGVGGDPSSNAASDSGAAYAFE